MSTALTRDERLAELRRLEAIIERGIKSFVEVGEALLKIKDKEYYNLEGFYTFEDYCRVRWDMRSNYANKLIRSATTMSNLYTKLGTVVPNFVYMLPENERQIRALTWLEPDEQVEVWTRAVKTAPNGRVTGDHVQRVVKALKTSSSISNSDTNRKEDDDEQEEAVTRFVRLEQSTPVSDGFVRISLDPNKAVITLARNYSKADLHTILIRLARILKVDIPA